MSEPSQPPQLTPAQIQQLIQLQHAMQQQKQPLSKKDILKQKVSSSVMSKLQTLIVHLDRFINFITKRDDADRNDVVQAARAPILFGTYIIILFVGIGFLWSALAPLDSAAHALGTVISSTNKKIVQYQNTDLGIIKAILVQQGDYVKAGQVLVQLEDTRLKSDYDSIINQYRTALATENRLIAQRDHLDSIKFDEFLMKDLHTTEVAKIIHTQEELFRSQQEVYRAEKEGLKQKVAQYHKQIEGYNAKLISEKKALEVINDRLKSAKALFAKGFLQKAALLEMESKAASIKSELSITETDIARINQEITKSEIEMMNLQNKITTDTLQQLREIQVNTVVLKEKLFTLSDALNRVEITSPVDGIVNMIKFSTIGAVIGQGQSILEISPINDHLIIEAKIPHRNIDSVHVGLKTKINFTAFKSRTTPIFNGVVVSISPDIVQDDKNPYAAQQEPYYIARVELDMQEFNKIAKAKNISLHPGMQADVQIVTGTRTLLRYLLDPLTDTMFKAFREK